MDTLFTWDYLLTFSGAIAAVTLLTQVLKWYIRVDPKIIALIATVIVEGSVQFIYLQDFTVEGVGLMIFNTFVILFAAVGAFENIVKPVERKLTKTY